MPPDHNPASSPRRGVKGVVLRAMRAKDTSVTVVSREQVSERFIRLRCRDTGLLASEDLYPTYWLRMWFTGPGGRGHQRAYTVVDPGPERGEFSLEFYLHEGIASQWARDAQPGDRIEATVLNGRNPLPGPVQHVVAAGDGASAPALADLLRRRPELPATILLVKDSADDPDIVPLPTSPAADVRWLEADELDTAMREAVSACPGADVMVHLEAASTRRVTAMVRDDLGIPKERLHSLAYWRRA